MKHAILALGLLFSLNSFAARPDGFDLARWNQLISKIFDKGQVMNIPAGELRYLSQIEPADTAKSHHSEYISLLGNYTNRAQYIPSEISAVDEDWQTSNGEQWVIDQWTYRASVDGELISVEHTRLTEDNGQVLDIQTLPAGDEAEQLQRWGAKLDQWLSRAEKL